MTVFGEQDFLAAKKEILGIKNKVDENRRRHQSGRSDEDTGLAPFRPDLFHSGRAKGNQETQTQEEKQEGC